MFDVVSSSSASIIEMHGLREALRTLPNFKEKELAMLQAEVSDIEHRQELAMQIAQQLRIQYPDRVESEGDLVASILQKLDGLQRELEMESDEILRKSRVFESIDADPVKKGLLKTALDTMKSGWNFSWKHKWKILAVIAVIATGVAGWYYWNQLAGLLGLSIGAGETGGGVAAGVEQAVEGATGNVAAVEAVGQRLSITAASILQSLGVSETAAHVLMDVNVSADGILYAGQTYTPEAFAQYAQTFLGQKGAVLVDGTVAKDATVGVMHDLLQAFEGGDIAYRLKPLTDDPVYQNISSLYGQ